MNDGVGAISSSASQESSAAGSTSAEDPMDEGIKQFALNFIEQLEQKSQRRAQEHRQENNQ